VEFVNWMLKVVGDNITGVLLAFLSALGLTHYKLSSFERRVGKIEIDTKDTWLAHGVSHDKIVERQIESERLLTSKLDDLDERLHEKIDEKFDFVLTELLTVVRGKMKTNNGGK